MEPVVWHVTVAADDFPSPGEASHAVRAAVPFVRGSVLLEAAGDRYVVQVPSAVTSRGEIEKALAAAGIAAQVRVLRSRGR